MAVRAPLAIVVRTELPYKTLADLVKGAETKPLTYGSPGLGNTSHLIGLMLAQASKSPMQAVHYRGEAPMISYLISARSISPPPISSAAMSRQHAARALYQRYQRFSLSPTRLR